MSTPPYYQNTPPPAKSNSGGCWKAVGIGCGVIVLLGVIGTIIAVQKFKQVMSDPKNKGLMGSIVGAGKTAGQGVQIQQAIVAYHDKAGSYPAKLTNLVPTYLPSTSDLHAPTDANPDPKHISWTYLRPTAGESPKSPLIKTPMVIEFGGQKSQSDIVINLDGTSRSGGGSQYSGGNAPQ